MKSITNQDFSRFMGLGEEAMEMRSRQHDVKISNVEIVQLAYISMEMIKKCIEYDMKLFFEQANGYYACFHLLRRLLKHVDEGYLAVHHSVAEFYMEGRELSTECDRLRFYDIPVPTEDIKVSEPVQEG